MPTSDRYLSPLERLGDLLATSTSFASVFDEFERIFMADRSFFAACEPVPHSPLLDAVLAQLATSLIGEGARAIWVTPLLRHRGAGFLHGAAVLGGKMTVIFYFERRDLGLATVAASTTHFARFTKVDLPPGSYRQRRVGHSQ